MGRQFPSRFEGLRMTRTVRLPDGTQVPALGQGTWHMGERRGAARAEADALRLGLDLGMTLIDTAEMYGEGAAEEVVAEAIAGRRDQVFLVSKVYPHNASSAGVPAACARSLRRLRTDRIDLYLLHWRGGVPLEETVAAFEALRAKGQILRWGVSNLDTDDMEELLEAPHGEACATDQVLYNPATRGIEFDLLPWCRQHNMPLMAYSPVGQGGGLLRNRALVEIARRHNATPAQIALAWCLRHPDVIAIPKAVQPDHVRENAAAAEIRLTHEDLAAIDAALPPPKRKQPLGIL
jgi:diketogulonate reductase-like aldo/keto reductase